MNKSRETTQSSAGAKLRSAKAPTGKARLPAVNNMTERRQAEELLRQSQETYRTLAENSPDIIDRFDRDCRHLYVNPAAARLHNATPEALMGKTIAETGVAEPYRGLWEKRIRAAFRNGQRAEVEDDFPTPEGMRHFHSRIVPELMANGRVGSVLVISRDVTRHKQAQAALRDMAANLERRVDERTVALRESAERLQAILSAAYTVAWELDLASGAILEIGPAAEFFGRPDGGPIRTDAAFFESVHPEDRAGLRAQIKRAVQGPASDLAVEFRLRLPDGSIRWVATSGSVERDAAGQPVRLRGVSRDISAHKQAEIMLARTHRALRVLTEGNRALVRATDERQLLNEACRIVVEVGGYRMAWLGYAEHDAAQTLRPMAWAGVEDDYLSRVPLTWADTGHGRGPGGVAIHTGRPGVCRNIATDPRFAPWREEALKRGYASALAMPLLIPQGCLGLLAIYAAIPDAFDDSEVELLQQLANDISFGIVTVRESQERLNLERQVLDISEREQRRIGQDLHDGVGQSIIGMRYLISAVQKSLIHKSAPEAAELEKIARAAGKTVQEIHDLSRGLFPGELRRGGIADALQELAAHTENVYGIACRFTAPTAVTLADANIASQVYRIAQEAVNNAARHSKSRTIDIRLSQKDGRLMLTIRDTGIGFSMKAAKSPCMGHRIMKYRADMIGATLTIESARGKGTTVTCSL